VRPNLTYTHSLCDSTQPIPKARATQTQPIPKPSTLHSRHQRTAYYLTETELRQLHRRIGHPAADQLHTILTKAGHDNVDQDIIKKINKFCYQC